MVDFSKTPWSNFKDSDYNDDQWKNACLVVDTECLKNSTPKQCCKLPVKEPNGTYNINGIQAAYGALQGSRGGVKITDQQRQDALNKLRSLYKQANLNIPDAMKASKPTEGPKGTIWSAGLHHVYVNDKPAKVYASKSTIPKTFQLMQDEIKDNGGIRLGIDHIPKNVLDKFPILKKLNPLDVGKITEVKTDGEKIYATKSEHTNPLVAELYLNGELPAYSLVAGFSSRECPTGQADYVIDEIKKVERADYVDEGGCAACKVGAVPEDVMTAKLSTEDNNMVKEPNQQKDPAKNEPIQDPKAAPATDPEPPADPKQDPEPKKEPVEPEPVKAELTVEDIKGMLDDFKADITTTVTDLVNGKTEKVEAKLSEMTLEARTAKVEAKVDEKIKGGFILPVQKELIMKAGLAYKNIEDFEKELAGYKTKVWKGGKVSKLEASNSEKVLDMGKFRKQRKNARF